LVGHDSRFALPASAFNSFDGPAAAADSKKIEERGIDAASRFKFIAGVAKSEHVWSFHVEAA